MAMMILKDSKDWTIFLENLRLSASKSNRDVLCTECWELINYEVSKAHKVEHPDHTKSMRTSRDYLDVETFMDLAKEKKHYYLDESTGEEYFENPYKQFHGRGSCNRRFKRIRGVIIKFEESQNSDTGKVIH